MAKCKGKTTKGQLCGRQVNGKGYCSAHIGQRTGGREQAITEDHQAAIIELAATGEYWTYADLAEKVGLNKDSFRAAMSKARRNEREAYASFASLLDSTLAEARNTLLQRAIKAASRVVTLMENEPEKNDLPKLLDLAERLDSKLSKTQKVETKQEVSMTGEVKIDKHTQGQLDEIVRKLATPE